MAKHIGCKCHPESPFLWQNTPRDSIFMQDKTMRTIGTRTDGISKSHQSMLVSEKAKREGRNIGTVHGISRDREQEIIRLRDFTTYSKARREDLSGVRVMENGNVAA